MKSDKVAARRFDLNVTHRVLGENPALAIVCAVVLTGAAAASLLGLLRWDGAFARWSFALLAGAGAIYCIARARSGKQRDH
jgi:hypothetical protein